ncbi:MAG: 1-acyl-sn-glycerol-3-phosphate acyltransferase [Oscillospiraceae bacterium]|jgi:1-acyl-sn-glycerol-3-phosphate acyltransferase|nr:1-acyl-sn-glycerol-3-phosphate acyltransferase [Oscillospiraceae bacterium]
MIKEHQPYTPRKAGSRIEDILIDIITNNAETENVSLDSHLKYDLGIDSLTMMVICNDIENELNLKIADDLINVETVLNLIEIVKNNNKNGILYDINNYPLLKTEQHVEKLKKYMKLSKIVWRFNVTGVENIPTGKNYILCPNHQSHFDSLWIWTAIGEKNVDLYKICCLAKQEHLDSSSSRKGLLMLGGIPVDRRGNTVPAMQRALACIKDGYTMLIHPEGTRTLDGKIHEFKGGAAKLAIDANVPLIPVRIEGAWNVFPPHRKRPKIFSWKGSYPLSISFGKPIKPDGKSVEELTVQLQSEVEKLGC